MNPEIKKSYEQRFKTLRSQYEKDLLAYNRKKLRMKMAGVIRKKKDPIGPKKPPCSFILFSQEERSKVKVERPDLNMCEITKELGRRWTELTPEIKQRYQEMATENQQKYNSDALQKNYNESILTKESKIEIKDENPNPKL